MPEYELAMITKLLTRVRIDMYVSCTKLHSLILPSNSDGTPLCNHDSNLITIHQEGFASVLRRTALFIMEKGGVVKKMENLGEQELPHRMRAHHEWNTHGR